MRSELSLLAQWLFPEEPRFFPWARPLQLVLRSLHLAAMAMVLGGIPFVTNFAVLRLPVLLTVLSGILLFAVDLAKDAAILVQGSGVAVLLKLVLLAMGGLQPHHCLPWFLAATALASVGSHMPGAWRHFSFLQWKVLRPRH